MKRILATIMILMLALSMCACGSTTEAETPAEASAGEVAAPAEVGEEIEPLTITFNSTYTENEVNGQLVNKFAEYLDELSGGKITLNVFWGGTVYSDATQFQALQSGAVDMISFQTIQDGAYVPYLSFGSYGIGSSQNVKELWYEMLFNDPEISALIQGEAAEYNMMYLNTIANGADYLISNFEWDTLDEFIARSQCIGTGDVGKFASMEMNTTFVIPPETYDALQRGICDSSTCSLSAIYAMSWDEVAGNLVMDGQWNCGGPYSVNLDFWNGLSEAQQNIILEAAEMIADYSLQLNEELEEQQLAEIEERSGVKVKYLNEEDIATYYAYTFDANALNALNNVKGTDKYDNMVKILQKAADYYGYDWTVPEL